MMSPWDLVWKKKMQFHYRQNECMGVPITWDILHRSCIPSIDNIFPYLYDIRTKRMSIKGQKWWYSWNVVLQRSNMHYPTKTQLRKKW